MKAETNVPQPRTTHVPLPIVVAVALAVVLSCTTMYAQVGCQDQLCDINRVQKCYRCINTGGATCVVSGGDCPNSCFTHICGKGPAGNIGKNDLFPACKLVLAQYRSEPIPKPGEDHVQMTIWPGVDTDPLQLIGVGHDLKTDLFRVGEVWNSSTQDVINYRIGWLIFPRNGDKPLERVGRLFKLKTPLPPNQLVNIPAQGVSPEESTDGLHNRIVFYVAEAILADGTDWRPDLTAIERKYNSTK